MIHHMRLTIMIIVNYYVEHHQRFEKYFLNHRTFDGTIQYHGSSNQSRISICYQIIFITESFTLEKLFSLKNRHY